MSTKIGYPRQFLDTNFYLKPMLLNVTNHSENNTFGWLFTLRRRDMNLGPFEQEIG